MSNAGGVQKKEHSWASIISGILVPLLVGCTAYYFMVPNSFSLLRGETKLDAALKIAKSTQTSFNAFKSAGGLETENHWKGFFVEQIETTYGADGVLAMATITVRKSFPEYKDGTLDNISSALKSECGSDWEQQSKGNLLYVQAKKANGVSCTVADYGEATTRVDLAFVPPEPVQQPPVAAVQPVQEAPKPQVQQPPVQAPTPVQDAQAAEEIKPVVVQDQPGTLDVATYNAVHVVQGKVTGEGINTVFALDNPVRIINKVGTGAQQVGDFHDGESVRLFQVSLEGVDLTPFRKQGTYAVTVDCPRAGCMVLSIKAQ